jgi:phosphoglycolate phosphatase
VSPDALIFDLDGTLWDAAAASTYGWNLALEELGLPQRVTVEGIRSVSGRPFPQCVETLLPELSPVPDSTLELLESRERTGIELIAGELYEGVGDSLPRLAARYPLFVVSNCPDWYLDEFFRHTGLRAHFTGWDCYGLSGIAKSGMLNNLAATHRLAKAVYVGDTEGDRDAAAQAGMDFVFVRYGFGRVERTPLASRVSGSSPPTSSAERRTPPAAGLRPWRGAALPADRHAAIAMPPQSPRSRRATPGLRAG